MKTAHLLGLSLLYYIPGIVCLPAADANTGCGAALPGNVTPGHTAKLSISSKSGVTPRKYRLHIPESYDASKKAPLILSFHGRGKNAEYQENLSQFSEASYGFQGISVYPEGVEDPSDQKQQWEGDPDAPTNISDVTFTLELLNHLQSTFCVDTTRIYAAGKSNGGGFTAKLACDSDASKRIAAFAPVSGANYLEPSGNRPPCTPSRKPLPILILHGFADNVIKYEGDDRKDTRTVNIPRWVDYWAHQKNDFAVNANKTSYLCSGKKLVTKYSWDDVVVHYNYTNVKHDWPTDTGNGDTMESSEFTCADGEATHIILQWFKKWTL